MSQVVVAVKRICKNVAESPAHQQTHARFVLSSDFHRHDPRFAINLRQPSVHANVHKADNGKRRDLTP
ncbi:hypothetical protein BST61_g2802 [Cercospora zeina]